MGCGQYSKPLVSNTIVTKIEVPQVWPVSPNQVSDTFTIIVQIKLGQRWPVTTRDYSNICLNQIQVAQVQTCQLWPDTLLKDGQVNSDFVFRRYLRQTDVCDPPMHAST